MKSGHLLPSDRRILCIILDDGPEGLLQAIDCQTVEHGTTFYIEDQFFIDDSDVHLAREHW